MRKGRGGRGRFLAASSFLLGSNLNSILTAVDTLLTTVDNVARQQPHLPAIENRTGTAMTSSLSWSSRVAMAIRGGPVSCKDWLLRQRGFLLGSAPFSPGTREWSSRLDGMLSGWGGDTPVGGCSDDDSRDSVSMETGS